ncbi:hypothetical protein AB0C40_22510 [Streptomyces brevispora]|uniref:hypothetical protein n=1 Tax=Streptomyces brevispora TaxID=887462 RepID=UPI0033D9F7DC
MTLLVPIGLAMILGWVPPWDRKRVDGVRLRGWGFLAVYAAGLVFVVPLAIGATGDSAGIRNVIGIGLLLTAVGLNIAASMKVRRGAPLTGGADSHFGA